MATPTILTTLLSPKSCKTSKDLSNSAHANIRFICIYHGWALFRRGSKNKLHHQFAAVTLLSNHLLCLQVINCCRLPKRMYFLLFNIAILFTNICATAIKGAEVVHSKIYRTESKSVYQRASEPASFFKIDRPFFALANFLIIQFLMIQLLVYNSWIINSALFNKITIDSLNFCQVALLFISLP